MASCHNKDMSRKLSFIIILPSLLALFILGFVHPITALTQDLGRHILLGKIIWTTQTIPQTNLLTYTHPDFPFINHHWLSEVIFYLITSFTNLSILGAVMILTASTAIGMLLWYAIKENYHPLSIGIFSLLFLQILFERTDTRPEIFGWVILSLILVILYSYREKYTKWIFLLPLMQLLWVNLHITFLVGLIIQGAFFLDQVITQKNVLLGKKTKALFIVCLLSLAACFINPHGIQGTLYPLTVFNNYGYSIEENQNIFFLQNFSNKLTIKYFYISIFVLFGALSLTWRRSRVVDWFLAIFFTLLGFYAIRNFPLFAFVVFLPAVRSLSLLFETWDTHSHLFKTYGSYIVWTIFAGLFCLSLFQLSSKITFSLAVPQAHEASIHFFQANHLHGPIFNNFDVGSYLEYRLYPKERLFIDGRPEAFPDVFIQGVYIPMQESPDVFAKADQTYHFNTIIFSHSDQTPWAVAFIQSILTNEDWKLIYLNSEIMILIKNTPENKAVITHYAKSLEDIPVESDGSFRSNQLLSRFFILTNTPSRASIYLKKLLEQDPNYCPAIATLAQIANNSQDPAGSVYQYQYLQKCQ